jgi:NAD binding domain of 6-phosphogluconate dehydrogenase
MPDKGTVGIIGLGVMGSALTQSLLESGFTVVGYDIDSEKVRRHTLAGGRSAGSPLEVAERAPTIVTSLPSVAALEAVLSGDHGLLSASALEDLVLIETSTLTLAAKFGARDRLAASGAVVLDIRTQLLTPLARLVGELSGVQQPSNRAVTGSRLFEVESGIIATWCRNVRDVDRTESLPYLPELVGQVGPRIVLGKGSGIDNIAEGLERIGVNATEEEKLEILRLVKARSLERKTLLDDGDFKAIADSVVSS